MTQEVPSFPGADYPTPQRDDSKIRAFREDVMAHLEKPLLRGWAYRREKSW